jgi:4-aminobutyrate aminotransferase-like enzyme
MDACGPGGLGGTYAGNPVACAAACAVLDVFVQERILERAEMLGARMAARLKTMAGRHREIAEVRALGAMIAMELCKDGDAHHPHADLTRALTSRARELGLILLSCGVYGNVIRILVPITAEDAVVDEGLDIIETAMDELCQAASARKMA